MPREQPVYEPLLTSLRTRILAGNLESGQMVGTEIGLAEENGISRSSVRQAISILSKEGLIERRPGKGIFVRETPPAIVMEMILPSLGGAWAGGLLDGAKTVAREHNAKLQIFSADGSVEADLSAIRRLPQMAVSGAIIVSLHQIRLSRQVVELHQSGFPLVLVDQRLRDIDIPSVTCDDLQAGTLAATHLLSLGHRRIGFVGFRHDDALPTGRHEGYRNALSDAELVIHRSLEVLYPFSFLVAPEKDSSEAVQKLLTGQDPPTAIVAQNSSLAQMCLGLADHLGRPQNPTIMTFASRREIGTADPRLLFVEIPEFSMGCEAARLLFERISRPDATPRHVVIPASLSTDR